jgi:hypothetical protein
MRRSGGGRGMRGVGRGYFVLAGGVVICVLLGLGGLREVETLLGG